MKVCRQEPANDSLCVREPGAEPALQPAAGAAEAEGLPLKRSRTGALSASRETGTGDRVCDAGSDAAQGARADTIKGGPNIH